VSTDTAIAALALLAVFLFCAMVMTAANLYLLHKRVAYLEALLSRVLRDA
jgi:hypothetical protein